jgi:hypothetical protein
MPFEGESNKAAIICRDPGTRSGRGEFLKALFQEALGRGAPRQWCRRLESNLRHAALETPTPLAGASLSAARVVAAPELEPRGLETRETATLSSKAWRALGPDGAKAERLTPGGA